jgi:hypothetical protein
MAFAMLTIPQCQDQQNHDLKNFQEIRDQDRQTDPAILQRLNNLAKTPTWKNSMLAF